MFNFNKSGMPVLMRCRVTEQVMYKIFPVHKVQWRSGAWRSTRRSGEGRGSKSRMCSGIVLRPKSTISRRGRHFRQVFELVATSLCVKTDIVRCALSMVHESTYMACVYTLEQNNTGIPWHFPSHCSIRSVLSCTLLLPASCIFFFFAWMMSKWAWRKAPCIH